MRNISKLLLLSSSLFLVSCGNTSKPVASLPPTQENTTPVTNSVHVFGTVETNAMTELYIDFPARITNIYVKPGDYVSTGTPLLSIDYTEYQNEIIKKEQALHGQEIKLEALKTAADPTTVEISNLKAQINQKERSLKNDKVGDIALIQKELDLAIQTLNSAKKDYDTYNVFYEAESISAHELETYSQNLSTAQNEVDTLKQKMINTKSELTEEITALKNTLALKQATNSNTQHTNSSDIELLQIDIQTAQLEIEEMKAKLNAPFLHNTDITAYQGDCLITSVSPAIGSLVSAQSSVPIISYTDRSHLITTVKVPESDIGAIHLGSAADVTLAYEDSPLKGSVSRISNNATNIDGESMVKVDISFDEATSQKLKLGFETEATIYCDNN